MGAFVAILAVMGVAASGASARIPHGFYGVVPNATLSSGDFTRMHRAHVGTLRFTIFWPTVQSSRNGPFNFAGTDFLVYLAAKRHIQLLPTLVGTPPFEANGCASAECALHIQTSRSKGRDWQAFVKAVAQRYGKGGAFWRQFPRLPKDPIRNYQIWNEVSNPNQRNSSKRYAKLLKLTNSALHKTDRHGRIVLSGMYAKPPKKKGGIPSWVYLKQLYRHHAKRHFEEAALHPYPVKPKDVRGPIKKMRAAMRRAHDAHTPLLISELGWGSSKKKHAGTGGRGAVFNVGIRKQKAYLKSSFKILTKHRRSWKLGGVDWFSWEDPQNAPPGLCAFCYSSGLYRAGGTKPKPSLAAYKQFARKAR